MAQKRKTYTIEDKTAIVVRVLKLMDKMSATKACQKINIAKSSFLSWVDIVPDKKNQPSFKDQYANQRFNYQEVMAQEILDITDEVPKMVEEIRYDKDGIETIKKRVDTGDVQNRRLRIDVRKWLLSKLASKKYGDKIEVTGDANLGTTNNITIINDIKNMNDNEVEDIKSNVSAMLEPSKKRF